MNGNTRHSGAAGLAADRLNIAEQWRLAVLGNAQARGNLLQRIMPPRRTNG